MDYTEQDVGTDDAPNEEKKGWFDRWVEFVERLDDWDETSHGCLIFPYSCW